MQRSSESLFRKDSEMTSQWGSPMSNGQGGLGQIIFDKSVNYLLPRENENTVPNTKTLPINFKFSNDESQVESGSLNFDYS